MSKIREFSAVAIDEAFKTRGVSHEELGEAAATAKLLRDEFDAAVKEFAPSAAALDIARRNLRRAIKDREGNIKKGCRFAVKLGIQYDLELAKLEAADAPEPENQGAAKVGDDIID